MIIQKCEELLFSKKELLTDFNGSFGYSYLLYAIFAFEKDISFGESKNPVEGMIANNISSFTSSIFFTNVINLLRKIFLSEEKEGKPSSEINFIHRIEEKLKWLYFYISNSENIIIINNYLRILIDIMDKCKK